MVQTEGKVCPSVSSFSLSPAEELGHIVLSEVEEDYRRYGRAGFGRDTQGISGRIRNVITRSHLNCFYGLFPLEEVVSDAVSIIESNFQELSGESSRQFFEFGRDFATKSYGMILSRIKDKYLSS